MSYAVHAEERSDGWFVETLDRAHKAMAATLDEALRALLAQLPAGSTIEVIE
jgi:hypothetical protein